MAWLSFLLGRLIPLGIAFLLLRALYRITLHPLAKLPGPKIAAVTSLWAASYDLSGKDSLVKHLKRLHDEYGPVVRIRPNEVHIFDWEAYHIVFKQGTTFHRPGDFYSVPQVRGSFFNNSENPKIAKSHRDLYITAFSKTKIKNLEPLIQEKTALLLRKLEEAAQNRKVVSLDMALQCLTADVTMYYCYQMDFGFLNAPDFKASTIVEIDESSSMVPFIWYLPALGKLMSKTLFEWLPDSFVKKNIPAVGSAKEMLNKCEELVAALAKSPVGSPEVTQSMFHTALEPNEKQRPYAPNIYQMTGDAVLVFLAGTDTTAHALSFGFWEMLKQPQMWSRLRQELLSVLPDAKSMGDVQDLEQLPYLKAVIKESLRFSMGTSARLPRIVPPGGATLAGQHMTSGTHVSFSHYVYNNDPAFFPDPHVFRPERWLGSKEEADVLEAHMVSFSRGSRSCIGMNLAYAELYTIMAHLVRRFDIENAGTTDKDMAWLDRYTPHINGHLDVRFKAVE